MEKIVDFSKLSIKKIRELIVFTALIVVALWKFDVVLGVIKAVWGIIFPFALGGAIAFVINVPMSFLEKKLFGKAKEKGSKAAGKLARPISLLLTIVLVVGVIVLVMFGLIPQLTATIGSLMNSIAEFIPQMQSWVRKFTHNNREIMDLVNQVEFNPNKAIQWGMSILGNGAGNFMNTTMTAVGSIVSGVTTFFIAFSFACYILFQKEKLHVQVRKVFFAFIPKRKAEVILEVCSLTYRTVPGSSHPRKYVCNYIKYTENAVCTADWNHHILHSPDPNLWSLHRLRTWLPPNLHGESETGNPFHPCISDPPADRR